MVNTLSNISREPLLHPGQKTQRWDEVARTWRKQLREKSHPMKTIPLEEGRANLGQGGSLGENTSTSLSSFGQSPQGAFRSPHPSGNQRVGETVNTF